MEVLFLDAPANREKFYKKKRFCLLPRNKNRSSQNPSETVYHYQLARRCLQVVHCATICTEFLIFEYVGLKTG